MIEWFKQKESRQLIVLLVVIVSLSFSIIYTDVRTFDIESIESSGYRDSAGYLNMYFGFSGSGVGKYRLLVPFLARLLPDIPSYLFPMDRPIDPYVIAAIKFGIINFFFLIGACLALYYLQRGFNMSYFEGFLGVMLFLSSTTVVRSAGLPMTDAAFFLFFALSAIAIQRNNFLLLLFAQIIGVLAKELVFVLSIPLILLSLFSWRRKFCMLLTSALGIAIYVVVRFKFAPSPIDTVVSGQTLRYFGNQLSFLATPRGLIKLFFSFGLAWIPAIYAIAFCKVPLLLKRWSWLIPIVFFGVLLFNGNFDRTTFSAFLVVIPLASLGLSGWLFSIPKR